LLQVRKLFVRSKLPKIAYSNGDSCVIFLNNPSSSTDTSKAFPYSRIYWRGGSSAAPL
jgi:hypothetical protein